jgi:hypothetical protein
VPFGGAFATTTATTAVSMSCTTKTSLCGSSSKRKSIHTNKSSICIYTRHTHNIPKYTDDPTLSVITPFYLFSMLIQPRIHYRSTHTYVHSFLAHDLVHHNEDTRHQTPRRSTANCALITNTSMYDSSVECTSSSAFSAMDGCLTHRPIV